MNSSRLMLAATTVLLSLYGCGDCYSNGKPGDCELLPADAGTGDSAGTDGTDGTDGAGDSGNAACDIPVDAAAARKVLETSCYSCHGERGTISGGMNYVLDVGDLIDRGRVTAGDAEGSFLYQRVADGSMPFGGDSLSDADQKALADWINNGAADFNCPEERDLLTIDDLLEVAYDDASDQDASARPYIRYLSLYNLYNSGTSKDDLAVYGVALTKLLNGLSRETAVGIPEAVVRAGEGSDAPGILYRIDLRDFGWDSSGGDPQRWEYLVSKNPYAVDFSLAPDVDGATFEALRGVTDSRMPFIMADWLVSAGSIPPLYHEILRIPARQDDFLAEFGVDAAENIATRKVVRAGFAQSGVSVSNRMIERHPTSAGGGGYCWVSQDFASSNASDNHNIFVNPIDPTFDGGEIICSMANGFNIYYLATAAGDRIDVGPLAIVADPNRRDADLPYTVINGLSCMNCHYNGMIIKPDEVLDAVHASPDSYSAADLNTIEELYPGNDGTDGVLAWLEKDAAFFLKSATDAALLPAVTENLDADSVGDFLVNGEPTYAMSRAFEDPITAARAATDVWFVEEELVLDYNNIRLESESVADVLLPLEQGLTIDRKDYELVVRDLICLTMMDEMTTSVEEDWLPDDPSLPVTLNEKVNVCGDVVNPCGPSGLACLDGQSCQIQKYTAKFGDRADELHVFGLCVEPSACDVADTCGDDIDNDCNGTVDDGATSFQDLDGDGFGNNTVDSVACAPPSGFVTVGGDCDDAAGAVNPSATEVSGDTVDSDCDGDLDN